MDYQSEILKAIASGNTAVEALVGRVDQIENLAAKSRRPGFGGDPESIATKGRYDSRTLTGERKDFDEFMRRGETKGLSAGSGPDGGFAVPKVIDGMMASLAVNISPIRAISQVQQISTSDFHKLVNVHGTASGWVGEAAARPATAAAQLKDVSPPMGELYANPQATQQMLDDVFFNAEQWISQEIATEFGRAEGAAFITGTGINQPLGFLSCPMAAQADGARPFGTLEYVATGAAGDFATLSSTVSPADILFSLVLKLKAAYRQNACWVMPKSILGQVASFKDYAGRFIFSPTVTPGIPSMLLGFPVVEAEDMPTKASNSLSIAFGNFEQGYLICDRIGMSVLRDPFSNKPNVGFYARKRVGGCVQNSECIKLLRFSAS